jgi:hypothetical protein
MLNVHFHACPKENKIKGGKEIWNFFSKKEKKAFYEV